MVPFVYLASVCWSFQCLISALTQSGRGGLLFRFICSVVLWGGRGHCRQMSVACVGSTPSTLGLPPLAAWAFPIYTARAPGCSIGNRPWVMCGASFWVLHKITDSVGPAFCAFPAQAAQAARNLMITLSLGAVRLIPSAAARRLGEPCVCSGELVSSRDPPEGCRPSRISGSLWLETGGLSAVW